LNQWIDSKLAEITNQLPTLVHQDPASFACGYNTGYKNALLDLEKHLDHILCNSEDYSLTLNRIYQSQKDLF